MKRKHKEKSAVLKKVALNRIRKLFVEAGKAKDQKLADRYVELARRIGMRYKTRIPPDLKRRYCKYCHAYLVPSKNCRVRLSGKTVTYYCFSCKKHMRIPYSKKK